MSRAKTIRKKLDYVPRWAWYLFSLFVGGPIGPIIVYLLFYALKKVEKEEQESESISGNGWEHTTENEYRYNQYDETADRGYHQRGKKAGSSASYNPYEYETETLNFEADDVDTIIKQGKKALLQIERANDLIPDRELSEQIDSIETSCRLILQRLEERPDLLPQLRSFLRYYLPTTLKLLNARAKLDRTAKTTKAKEVRNRISKALGEIDSAFKKQLDTLDEYSFVDLESEIDVLTDMLKADGLYEENQTQTLGR